MDKKEFRKDINSLRAIAVISVIFFHFFYNIDEEYSFTIPFLSDYFSISIFQAGYLGVDIFFVVSGFLMTKIIVTGLDKDSFSVWKFWKARAKRICPALFFMLCFFSIVAYLLFWNYLILNYSRQVQWALLFISNLRFAHRVDYFADNNLLSNVLLHCWSLSVEWQFYILYPFLLIFISKYFKNWRLKILSLLFVASFITSLLLLPNSAYYYLQARAWELLAGGIVFLLPQNKWQWLNKKSYIILVLFVFVICFSPKDWNSFSALLIVLLTSLVIYINKKDSFLFNSKIVQYLGKISYSLYLYHWPIVSFYVSFFSFSYYGFFIALILIFLLASLSYFFIERSRKYSWKFLISYLFLGLFVTCESSAKGTLIKEQIYPCIGNVYISSPKNNEIQQIKDCKNIIVNGDSTISSKILILGDSNAMHYSNFMHKNFPSFYSLTLGGTLAYSDTLWKEQRSKEERDSYIQDLNAFLKKHNKSTVFLSNRWTLYFFEKNRGRNSNKVLQDIDIVLGQILQENKDDHFIVIGVSPILPTKIFNTLVLDYTLTKQKVIFNFKKYINFTEKEKWKNLDNLLKNYFSKFSNVTYISPIDYMCQNRKCKIYDDNGNYIFSDIFHFSKYGSDYMEPYLLEAYKEVNDKR